VRSSEGRHLLQLVDVADNDIDFLLRTSSCVAKEHKRGLTRARVESRGDLTVHLDSARAKHLDNNNAMQAGQQQPPDHLEELLWAPVTDQAVQTEYKAVLDMTKALSPKLDHRYWQMWEEYKLDATWVHYQVHDSPDTETIKGKLMQSVVCCVRVCVRVAKSFWWP
jgi:hypothetical protein